MRFSIIIPVFNVEKYIRACLDSIVAQTFQDYEVILVNDVTQDNSASIAQEYVDRDPARFRLLHHETNQGAGGARNTGMASARGDFLVFADADDTLRQDMLEGLDQKLREYHCDVLLLDYARVYDSGKTELNHLWGLPAGLYDENAEKIYLRSTAQSWNKVVSRRLQTECQVVFPENIIYEDLVTWIWLIKAKRVYLWDEAVYFYYIREGSSVHTKNYLRNLDMIAGLEAVRSYLNEHGLYEKYKTLIDEIMLNQLVGAFYRLNMVAPRCKEQVRFAEYLERYFKDYRSYPNITPWVVQQADLIRQKKFMRYYRIIKVRCFKAFLLQNPLIARLNCLRKKLRG